MEKEKKCYVCEGTKPDFMKLRCEEHDRCDVCNTKRKDLEETPWGTKTGFICKSCSYEKTKAKIEKFQQIDEYDRDLDYRNDIKCPYCGRIGEGDIYEDEDDYNCGECGLGMKVEVYTSTSYSTEKKADLETIEQMLNNI